MAVRTPTSRLETDLAVLAAGTGAAALAESIGGVLSIDASPAVLLRFSVDEPVVNHILSGPELELRHCPDGSLLLAEYYPEAGEAGMAALAAETAERLCRHYAIGGALSLLSAAAGFRPFPRSGWPIIGFLTEVEGVYVTVAHPGVVLAPFIGRIATDEILDGKRDPGLAQTAATVMGRWARDIYLVPSPYLTSRAKARRSSISRPGSSRAAKWPPRGISLQRWTL